MTATSKIALVTGASSGIGLTYAERLAKRGHDLVLVARDAGKLERLAQRLGAEFGVGVEVLAVDLADPAGLALAERRLAASPVIGMLVNCAGVVVAKPVDAAFADAHESQVRINAIAPLRLCCAAMTSFGEHGGGTIVNVGSVMSLMPRYPVSGVYGASKAFLAHLSASLEQEGEAHNIRVQVVLPGATRTAIWENSGLDVDDVPSETLMEVGDLVDAALSGLDSGESVTIPSLPHPSSWRDLEAAREGLMPYLSNRRPADRYGVPLPSGV